MKQHSALLSSIATVLCMAALIALCFFAPALTHWYIGFRNMQNSLHIVILVVFYASAVPAMLALCSLLTLLHRIHGGNAFQKKNSRLLGTIAWCCIAVAVFCAVGALFYLPFLFITAAMLFLFLIVRVVRNCFITATILQEENSLTI